MEGWRTDTLENLCRIGDGNHSSKYPKKAEMIEAGVPFIRGTNIIDGRLSSNDVLYISPEKHEQLKKGHLKSGDVLFTNRGEIGKVAIVSKEFDGSNLNSQIAWLRCEEKLISEYLFYFLQSKGMRDHFEQQKSGAALQQFTIKMLKAVEVSFPPILEQKRIVAILDQAFAEIEQARAKTEQNLKNARELFESYLQQVFSQRGEGWVKKEIGCLTSLITKGSSPKWQGINYVEEPGVLFVTSENVGVNQMIYKKTKYVEEAFNRKGPKSILNKGDVLTNIVGASIGRTAIFDREDVANINQAVCLMRCNEELLFNEYLAYLLNSPYLVKVLHDNEIDNARANLSLGFFRGLDIPVPSLELQKSLVTQIKAMHSKTQDLEVIYQKKLHSLNELKKSILQKAFNGELEIKSCA